MSLILNIETATKSCSVALAKDGQLLDCIEEVSEKYSHAEQLTVFIQDILAKHQFSTKDLDAVAISSGPGSYTGLRIGVSTAKGMCYALDIPLISVSTLEAMAQVVKDDYAEHILCPMIDARRMEVYCAFFGKHHSPVSAKVIEADSFAAKHTNADDLISSLVKLYRDNASTLTPDRLYSAFHDSHPSATIRINHLKASEN